MPKVTILMNIHMKPTAKQALESLVKQTRLNDVEIIVIDSGQWLGKSDDLSFKMAQIYRKFRKYPNIEWYFTGEEPNFHERKCPIGYWTNKAIEFGLVRGEYLATFYDDDIYYPQFIEKMAGYLDQHPECEMVRCTEDWKALNPDGVLRDINQLRANAPIKGENFLYNVDGMQIMMRTLVLDRLDKPYLVEEPDQCRISDGIFLNKVGKVITQCDFIDEPLCCHHFTKYSTYTKNTAI